MGFLLGFLIGVLLTITGMSFVVYWLFSRSNSVAVARFVSGIAVALAQRPPLPETESEDEGEGQDEDLLR